jgi:hypothetical protein
VFTEKQIVNYCVYEQVRLEGQINMWDALNGCRLSDLTKDEYIFVMENYSELKKATDSKGK